MPGIRDEPIHTFWPLTRHGPSRAYCDKKRAEGKRHEQAIIALARRRLDTFCAMLRDGTLYQEPENPRGGVEHALAA